jgi:hypothetical protein
MNLKLNQRQTRDLIEALLQAEDDWTKVKALYAYGQQDRAQQLQLKMRDDQIREFHEDIEARKS